MEATKGNQSNASKTKRNETEMKTETENKTKTDPGYLDNREDVDNVSNHPEETAANASFCILCKNRISSLKCENLCVKTHCVNLQKELHEDSKNACTSENTRSQKCRNNCCIVSSKICSGCLCVDCWKDPERSCSKCQCCCEEEDEFQLDHAIQKEEKDRGIAGSSEDDITKREAKESYQLEKIYERVLEEMKKKEEYDEQNNTTKKTVRLNAISTDAEESIGPAAEKEGEDMLQNTPNTNENESTETAATSKQEDDENEDKGLSKGAEDSHAKQVTNLREETCLRRFINFLYSFIYGNAQNQGESFYTRIINYFYGFFQQPTTDTNMNPRTGFYSLSPRHA